MSKPVKEKKTDTRYFYKKGLHVKYIIYEYHS